MAMSLDLLYGISENAINLAKKLGADQAQAVVSTHVKNTARFANSQINQNLSTRNNEINIKVVVEKRLGSVKTSLSDQKSVQTAVRYAIRKARATPPNEMFKSLPMPKEYVPIPRTYDRKTAECSPSLGAEIVNNAIETAHTSNIVKAVAGSYMTGSTSFAVVNSRGVHADMRISIARLHVTVISAKNGSEGFGSSESWARKMDEINVSAVAQNAAETSAKSVQPERLEPGEYETVLSPEAVAVSMEHLGASFKGTWYQDGISFVKNNIGKKVLDEKFNLKDDARDMSTLYVSAVDGEGVPKRPVSMVHAGVVDENSICYNSYTAGRVGLQSTGHAQAPFFVRFEEEEEDIINMIVSPGDSSTDEMIKETQHGVYVSRFHYVRSVNRPNVTVTGLTRDGTFLIKNGELARPVHNLRFTDSFLDAYKNIKMIGREQVRTQRATVPSLKIAKLRFSGIAE